MSKVYFYDTNLNPIKTVAFPIAVIHTDRISDIPDAQITISDRDYVFGMTVGAFFRIHGVQQIFRVSEISISIGEDADGTFTIAGQEFGAWLLTTRIWQRDYVPSEDQPVGSVVSTLMSGAQNPIPVSALLVLGAYDLTDISSCIVAEGDTLIDYLQAELEAQGVMTRFTSWTEKTTGQWPIRWDLAIGTDAQKIVLPYSSPKIKTLSVAYRERESTEISYAITGWYNGSPADTTTSLSRKGLVSEFSWDERFDDPASGLDKRYSSIGVILKDGGDLDASSLSIESVRTWPWDAFNTNARRDAITGGTVTYKDGKFLQIMNPRVTTNMPVLTSSSTAVPETEVVEYDYSAHWGDAPSGTEFIFAKAWDDVYVDYIASAGTLPALTFGVISKETYRQIKTLYEWVIPAEMDIVTGAYKPTWNPESGTTSPYHIVVPRNTVYRQEGGQQVLDEEASLQASRVWYKGRGWVYLVSVISGWYQGARLVLPGGYGPDRGAWIEISRLTTTSTNGAGNVSGQYSFYDNPEYGHFPILASALEMKEASKLPPRRPSLEVDVTFSETFAPAPGTEITLSLPGGGSVSGRVSALTTSEEGGSVTYDAEVSEWKQDEDPAPEPETDEEVE